MSRCPLCDERKGKRSCPAKHAEICSACCGSKRLVEIACPDDCAYLTGAHAASWEGRESERRLDARRVAPHVTELDDTQSQLFFLALLGVSGIRASHRQLDDTLLLAAVRTLRKTVETRVRGILYEHSAPDPRAQAILEELRGVFESQDEEGRPVAPADRDVLAVLAAIEASLEGTLKEGAAATAFLDTAARLVGSLKREARPATPSRLIVEP